VKLHARAAISGQPTSPVVARVTCDPDIPSAERRRHALRVASTSQASVASDHFAAVLLAPGLTVDDVNHLCVALPPDLDYVSEGDVIRIDPARQHVDVLYRRRSPHNSVLVTEQCNSRCVMCSQPPVPRDDGYLVEDLLKAIPLMSPETIELGITGGEPTLLHDGLIRLLVSARDHLPHTAVHLLTNGRLFAYIRYAEKVAEVRHHDLMLGIPLYSDLAEQHDYVVQARGAFDQTVRGFLNLGRYQQRLEVRVVLHRLTYRRLPQLARFIARNLPFVEQVALMGLEPTGYTRLNLEALWMEPADYGAELAMAVELLDQAGILVKIYNHQLCVLDDRLWRFAVKSISDWKNVYMDECEACGVREQCGGFFASAELRRSAMIHPIRPSAADSSALG
jgi:His-Xaa-Ser system radical SAM maturase HxsC